MKTLFSIGALSKSTSIPVETLRTWERRYGFPVPIRTESGHRRYLVSTVERLRLVKTLLDQGHKPSTVVAAPPEELRSLLGWQRSEASPKPNTAPQLENLTIDEMPKALISWLSSLQRYDGIGLERGFRSEWGKLTALDFVTKRAGPFLQALGGLWALGEVSVMQEHFASERLKDFLSEQWRPLSDKATGPRVILSNLSGDRHAMGLSLAAVILAIANVEVIYLGADTPVSDICSAYRSFKAKAIVLSVSSSIPQESVQRQLEEIRQALPPGAEIVTGGAGAPKDMIGIRHFAHFSELNGWVRSL